VYFIFACCNFGITNLSIAKSIDQALHTFQGLVLALAINLFFLYSFLCCLKGRLLAHIARIISLTRILDHDSALASCGVHLQLHIVAFLLLA
jgi:hypothetical protein